jgi:hypothetical protein
LTEGLRDLDPGGELAHAEELADVWVRVIRRNGERADVIPREAAEVRDG